MSEVDPLDLSNLQMLPDWVKQPQEKPQFKEEPVRPPKGGKGRGKGGGGFGGGFGGGDRRGSGPPRGRRDDGGGGGRGQRRDDRRGGGSGKGKGKGKFNDRRGGQKREQRPPQDLVPKDVRLTFQPAGEGVAFISQQIKTSGCAYPVFDLARLILNNRDRYSLVFESKGETKLFLCALDNSLWLSRNEAVNHATHCKEFSNYYQEEQVSVDPPKGNFSSIAVCGLSGKLLGPPNHHSYQENIIRVHAERFPRMHIDGYRRKIKMERGEEIVEKWKEQESTQSHFTLLKGEEGAEPVVFKNRQEAVRHFSENFANDLVRELKKATIPGDISGRQLARPLFNLLKQEGERLRKFPMDMVQRLCRAFEKQGLKFFKEGKKTTYVARLRPRQITNEEKFSDGIRKIVSYVRSHPNTKLNDLAGALIPESKRSSAPPKPKKKKNRRRRSKRPAARPQGPFTLWTRRRQPAAVPAKPEPPSRETPAKTETAEAAAAPAVATGPFTLWTNRRPAAPEKAAKDTSEKAEPPAAAVQEAISPGTLAFTIWTRPYREARLAPKPTDSPAPAKPAEKPAAAPSLTPEEIAVLQDLRWLIREGYVIEFSNGTLKLPRSPEPPKKKVVAKKAAKTPQAKASAGNPPKPTTSPTPAQPSAVVDRKPDPTPTSAPPSAGPIRSTPATPAVEETSPSPSPDEYPKPNNSPTSLPPSTTAPTPPDSAQE